MTDFQAVAPPLAQALRDHGYTDLTPVQEAVLDPALGAADALVSAQTGSGKTVAFGLALAPTLLEGKERFGRAGAPLALVIAPTRELALQVRRELEWLYARTGAVVAACVGGMDMRDERRVLQGGVHLVVGTPGRLRDHIGRNSLAMASLRAVVLDEADEMLDLGFREDLEFILDAAPEFRRTLMFSATLPRAIVSLAGRYQRDAARITTAAERTQHADIEYRALPVVSSDRENGIVNVLRYYEARNAMVFCSTRAAVNHLSARFNNRGFAVVALSGELSQNERSHALQAMRDGRARVCIATDVAARGIDLPGLELVIHADLPTNPDMLLHRSGRTGRAGRKGVSVLIVPHNARRRAEALLRKAGINAEWSAPPSVNDVLRRDEERLLSDPALEEPIGEDERVLVTRLLERHGAERVGAALVRLFRIGRSAPEELLQPDPGDQRRPTGRSDNERAPFGDSIWFALSVGRKQKAEPKWLLPMLCRAGQITRRDIGAIRIEDAQTHVQISAAGAEKLLATLGPAHVLERNIRIRRLDREPGTGKDTHPRSRSDLPKKARQTGRRKNAGKSAREQGRRAR